MAGAVGTAPASTKLAWLLNTWARPEAFFPCSGPADSSPGGFAPPASLRRSRGWQGSPQRRMGALTLKACHLQLPVGLLLQPNPGLWACYCGPIQACQHIFLKSKVGNFRNGQPFCPIFFFGGSRCRPVFLSWALSVSTRLEAATCSAALLPGAGIAA